MVSSQSIFEYSTNLTWFDAIISGISKISDDMDTDDCPLMGAHGYCSQEMVHLLQGTIHILRKHL